MLILRLTPTVATPENSGGKKLNFNRSYVLNVIENPEERAATLKRAWALRRQLLVVSAQVHVNGRGRTAVEFGDGVRTERGTFQKYFEQAELRTYLETQLQAEALPAGIGTFYLFKDEAQRQQFLADRFRRREILPPPHPCPSPPPIPFWKGSLVAEGGGEG